MLADIGRQLDNIKPGRVFVIATVKEVTKVASSLRTSGRFEKDLPFLHPNCNNRLEILRNYTSVWKRKPSETMLKDMTAKARSYNLSRDELRFLCRTAYNAAFQRQFSSVCKSDSLKLSSEAGDAVEVSIADWTSALDTFKKPEEKKVVTVTKSDFEGDESLQGEVIDPKLGFSVVGGLDEQMKEIRENVLFPLGNKESLAEWGIEPVKGIIFHGPPGTGKTLLAKSLAAELSRLTETPYKFYCKKGSDSIQKYVGWTEAYLKELFEKAKANKPAIIFFDEIDGLCGKRQEGE